jgi:hypothetical protein
MGRWRTSARTVVGDVDLRSAAAFCAEDPVASVLAATRIESALAAGADRAGASIWGVRRDGVLEALCWAGANMVPVCDPDDAAALDAFADAARRQGRRCSSIVGEARCVLGLWERLADAWGPARDVRADQPSLVIDHAPWVAPDPAGAYEARVRSLVDEGRTFVRIEDGPAGREVVFKADLGAVSRQVAQVQGVWVTPRMRGRRISEHGMATVVQQTLGRVAPVVSLYVNSYNAPALACYRAVGFRQVGTYATVLF